MALRDRKGIIRVPADSCTSPRRRRVLSLNSIVATRRPPWSEAAGGAAGERGGRLFILGVGGSAANASHAVNDFRKIAQIEAYAPTDNVSELTARTNDEGWETRVRATGCGAAG